MAQDRYPDPSRLAVPEAHRDYSFVLFIQLNDIYHIDYCADFTKPESLLLPRIATVIQRLRNRFGRESVILCVPGDFLAPSCLSKEFRGQQMVEVFNTIGVDLVCPGNHEFDLGEDEQDPSTREQLRRVLFEQCVAKSKFSWLLTNLDPGSVAAGKGFCFKPVHVVELSERTRLVLLGFLWGGFEFPDGAGETIDPVKLLSPDQVHWLAEPVAAEAGRSDSLHLLVALTHLELASDRKLLRDASSLHLIMGGHDHEVVETNVEESALIVKARSNGRTIRINFAIDFAAPFDSRFSPADVEKIMLQATAEIVEDVKRAALETADPELLAACAPGKKPFVAYDRSSPTPVLFSSFYLDTCSTAFQKLVPQHSGTRELIHKFISERPGLMRELAVAPILLELADTRIRRESTNFGILTAEIMRGRFRQGERQADAALITGGTFRLDRDIAVGERITVKVLCDIFYYRTRVYEYQLSGAELLNILNKSLGAGRGDLGDGEFLQISGISVTRPRDGELSDDALRFCDLRVGAFDMNATYRIAVTDYISTKSKAYKTFFEGRHFTERAPDLQAAVEHVLTKALEALEKASDFKGRCHGWHLKPPRKRSFFHRR